MLTAVEQILLKLKIERKSVKMTDFPSSRPQQVTLLCYYHAAFICINKATGSVCVRLSVPPLTQSHHYHKVFAGQENEY